MNEAINLSKEEEENQNIEIQVLLEALFIKYGYDFRNYSRVHVKRRMMTHIGRHKLNSISELQHLALKDPEVFHSLLIDLSLNVTEMFRDPEFFVAIRQIAVPILKTYPFLKIWHAGCSTGEEVYSMAILLHEEGLLDKSIIYATDFNQTVLKKAAEAIYPVSKLKSYVENYQHSLGIANFSDYFTIRYGNALINKNLKQNIVFSDHNLVTDGVFGEMNMIVCRNVLIYFNRELQNRVYNLFNDSLLPGGLLCLGSRESLLSCDKREEYKKLSETKIYKKLYLPNK
jgi:chemotaxis protein methyltransferase CheR